MKETGSELTDETGTFILLEMSDFIAIFFLLSAVQITAVIGQEDSDNESSTLTVGSVEEKLESELKSADAPLEKLKKFYIDALSEKIDKAQEQGNLDKVLALKKERDDFSESGVIESTDDDVIPELVVMRKIYLTEKNRISSALSESRLHVWRRHGSRLEELIRDLTRKDRLDEAVAVRQSLQETEERISELAAVRVNLNSEANVDDRDTVIVGPGGKWEKNSEIEVEKTPEGLVLKSPMANQRIQSVDTFTPPYKIVTRAKTNTTNIRFFFGPTGMIVFNWEMNPERLQFKHPVSARITSFEDRGEIDQNEFHNFEIEVGVSDIKITVDDRRRASVKGDFRGAAGHVGIGPCFGSVVTVEQMWVKPLK